MVFLVVNLRSNTNVDGVMPGIRLAAANVGGWIMLSFSFSVWML